MTHIAGYDQMSIPSFDTAQYLNRYSTKAVTDFLEPRGPLDRAYLLSLAFWFCTSIFFKVEPMFRALSFFFTIFFLVLSNIERKRIKADIHILGSTIKLFIISLLIGFFVGKEEILFQYLLPFEQSYLDFESFILIITLLFGIFLNSFKISLLKNYGFDGYQAFIKSLFRGFWVMGITLYLLVAFDILKQETPVFGEIWEETIFYALVAYLIVSLLPYSYNPLSNFIQRRNSLASFRDHTFGATLTLIVFEFIFKEFKDPFWNSFIPFLFLASIILFVIRDNEVPYLEKLYSKSILKTREMAEKLNQSEFQVAEDVFTPKKSLTLIKKGSSNLSAGKNSILVPITSSQDIVTVEAIGDLTINVKDTLGRIKKEATNKATFILPKKEWTALSKRMNSENLNSLDITKLNLGITSKEELVDNVKSSFQIYKEKFNSMGIDKLESNLQMMKNSYNLNISESKTEFNFPGIKVIEEGKSMLFKMGSIEAIDVKRDLPDDKEAKYFNIKMPFITASEIEHEGRYFALNMPFISALETPKGLMLKIFGIDVAEGNKQAILNDLDRMMKVQSKFYDYYNFRMSNVLAVEDNPNFVLTQGEDDSKPKLLLSGVDDSFYIDDEQPEVSTDQPRLIETTTIDSSEIIDISEEDVIILEDQSSQKKERSNANLDVKLEKLSKRIDKITKDEFIDYMGFSNTVEFLDWLSSLPEESAIRVKENTVYLK